ncbi:MAG: GNAT family N-acetyltransferase [Candidatus Andeanibacterium colombiense]|uniref:GNAT family N-acetyltransferase n=1 Tax=Candidatus Andeanibacterium colombiense TaxID=3121345 RepID=A0AAJ5X7L0_9SPHN|nr:MAG: GNAT family N-acetyltransferase [Sphingomonadaceae bacterium]
MTQGKFVAAITARLVIRTEVAGDFEQWLAQLNTPEVLAFLGGPRSEEEVAQSFARMREAHERGEPTFYMVALKDGGGMIGRCGLSTIDPPQAPAELRGRIQIGWTIHPGHWGKGYATEAAQAMLKRAFGHFDAPVVYGQTSQTNVPSWRLMEKLGMTRMAQFDYEDPDYPPQDNPTMVYRLLREEWRR